LLFPSGCALLGCDGERLDETDSLDRGDQPVHIAKRPPLVARIFLQAIDADDESAAFLQAGYSPRLRLLPHQVEPRLTLRQLGHVVDWLWIDNQWLSPALRLHLRKQMRRLRRR